MHLALVLLAGLVFHGMLAQRRPGERHLTEYYFWLSLGGALAGIFNGLAAPLVFNSLLEYPLTMVMLGLLLPPLVRPEKRGRWRRWLLDMGLPVLLGLLAAELLQGWPHLRLRLGWLPSPWDLPEPKAEKILKLLGFGLPLLVCFLFVLRPLRFGLGLAAIVTAGMFFGPDDFYTVYRTRSFFGALQVTSSDDFTVLFHGTTLHGLQSRMPGLGKEPFSYYFRTGPVGQIFDRTGHANKKPNVAILGLGAGTLAAYGQLGQHFTFYEIDGEVRDIARHYFTFLGDAQARGVDLKIILGDGRLQMRNTPLAPEEKYGLIFLDAFTSDAIPMHLLTREALADYRAKLADDGIIVYNISNRYVDLRPILANLADAIGWQCLVREDPATDEAGQPIVGNLTSVWVVLAAKEEHFGMIAEDIRREHGDGKHWEIVHPQPCLGLWTDNYSNLFRALVWRQ
jgi:hypothetical protein